MPPEIAARIAAGQELRKRGKLTPEQNAALSELERRYSAAPAEPPTATPVAPPAAAAPPERPVVSSGAGGSWTDTPREAGRARALEEGAVRGPVSAAIQGAGSAAFGIGTPITAAGEYISSRMPGGDAPRSFGESLEVARGYREGAYEKSPGAYRTGFVGGLYGSGSAVKHALVKAPAAVKSVFALQKGQTARNIARLSAAGAATAGTTAGMQEGAEAVPAAATAGAVLGPAVAGLARGAVGAGRWVGSKIDPSNAAIRILAKRLGESADAIALRYNQFTETMGRRPRLIEIMRRESAEEMGQISASKVGVEAGRAFREAGEETALARPRELKAAVERGGRTTTVPEQQAELAPITEEARRVVGSRVLSTETAQLGRRDKVMDAVMNRIGNQQVNLGEEIREVIEHPDVQSVLSPALRRRVNDAIQQGEDMGTINIPVRTWEMIRQDLAGKAGAGAGQIYSRLRDRVRDYVGERVPEYGAALSEFGRRSGAAKATTAGRAAITKDAREFADMLISNEPRPAVRVSEQVGARIGARTALANQLNGTPQQAERMMARLARDNRLRSNLRAVMSREELSQLESLGEQYGHRLNIIEGGKVGAKVMMGDADRFADAVRTASAVPGGASGVRTSARGALAGKAGESPSAAVAVASQLAENPGLQQRLTAALGGAETGRLQGVGELSTRAARNLAASAPRGTDAQARAASQAQQIQEIITGGVILAGRSSGALRANFLNNITQRLRMSKGAAKRLAEMAVDPKSAHIFIGRVRAAGVKDVELLRWYQDAAVAAGITVGAQ